MSCTSKIHPFSLGNYFQGTSLIIGNLMIIRVTGIERTWLGLVWPHAQYVAKHHSSLLSNFSLENSLYFGGNNIISFQKVVGDLNKTTIANLGRQHQSFLDSYFKSSKNILYLLGFMSFYFIPSILLKLVVYIYILKLILLMFSYPSIIKQLYVICHIHENVILP